MDIRQLEYFEAVARLGNFTRAAEELFISQPGISASIRKLEAELGTELLQRTSDRAKPTPAGRILLERARQVLAIIHDARDEISTAGEHDRESVRVGLPPMLGARFLAPLLTLSTHPGLNLDVTVQEDGSHRIREQIQERKLDLGVVLDDPPTDQRLGLITESLGTSRIMLGLAPDHPLAKRERVPVRLLAGERLVVMPPGAMIRDLLIEELIRHGIEPNIAHTSTQINLVNALVRSGFGLSVFPETMARVLDGIVLRPLEPAIERDHSIVYRQGTQRTAGFLAVAALITEMADSETRTDPGDSTSVSTSSREDASHS